MPPDADRDIAELYAVPPKEFVRARNAKAAALKAAGRAAEAKAVQGLAKPAPSLWATNQLARLDPTRVSRLIEIVQRVRRTQLSDPRGVAEAMQTQRAELEALTTRAAEALTKAGYRVSPPTLARVSNTLLGAAVDQQLADDLRHGRLTAELPAPGFEVLSGLKPDPGLRLLRGGKAAECRNERSAAERAREQAAQERAAQEAEAQRRDALRRAEAAARAEQEVRDLERQLADARRRQRAAQREVKGE